LLGRVERSKGENSPDTKDGAVLATGVLIGVKIGTLI
jgi:hypothetical protein